MFLAEPNEEDILNNKKPSTREGLERINFINYYIIYLA